MTTPEVLKKPEWLKVKAPTSSSYHSIKEMLQTLKLATVCQEARCPNMDECWSGDHATATFMLMGDTCTRGCKFCAVKTGNPHGELDHEEPNKVGEAISKMNLKYVVLTSVDRDDLPDYGAEHFAKTVEVIKKNSPSMVVEILTPDFLANRMLIERVVNAKPDVFAHNIETVQRLSPLIRDRRATHTQSLETLRLIKVINPKQITKSSIMLGLGETEEEVLQALNDLRSVDCDVVTFGQYLPPTKRSYPLTSYIKPEEFITWHDEAMKLGFKYVASGPLVRSSYKAGEFFMTSMLNEQKVK